MLEALSLLFSHAKSVGIEKLYADIDEGNFRSKALFEKLGFSKRDAKETVEVFFEEIRRALEGGEQVKLSGFGNFDLRDKNQRPGRNPKTGEDIPISARRVVTFRPGQKLKARVENLKDVK